MNFSEIIKPDKKKIVSKILILFGIFFTSLLILLFSSMAIVCKGPSKTVRDLFVTTCMETSFAKLFPPLYLDDELIHAIIEANSVMATTETTDIDTEFVQPVEQTGEQKDIEVIDIVGSTYKGKLMIVLDPSRVVTATPDSYGKDVEGEKLDKMMQKVDAVAGINGGGFVDVNGVGNGGIPLGIVVKNKVFAYGENGGASNVIGLDENNVLHVGSMTSAQAKSRKIRDAVSFGPPLIINGNPVKTVGSGGGLNPRTAIGQRKDGAVLLLVLDGRQPHSLGANFKDLIDIMVEHGAVNAGNLDGGSSSMLYYNNELISTCSSLYGPRKIPSAFVVLPK